ncbi:MAG: phosphoribosylformylglycinamidine synthase subunit PurQ [Candidatus Desulfaltia sp.]|nr:phosphoribosylformylglycinamidine synthase subunit PurQ [Candidatus Desulfaltia sp.]
MKMVNALVLAGYGLNCDNETAYALELAGASASRVHINSLIDGSVTLDNFQIMVFVGGFSWGDDHGAGVIQAVRLKTNIGDKILEFVDKGNLVLGICNGFQTLVNMGLLPGFKGNYKTRSIALTFNDCGNFRDDWVMLKVNPLSPCVFTKGFDTLELPVRHGERSEVRGQRSEVRFDKIELPIRHGEGKFYSDKDIIQRLTKNNQVVIQYAMPDGNPAEGKFPFNPNGSINDIAGICDPTGRIFGLMPHPEAFNHWTNHPDWTRDKEKIKRRGGAINTGATAGIRMFQNGVDFICSR